MNLNPEQFSKGTAMVYPHFLAKNPDDAFQLMCYNLEKGDIPLYLDYKGKVYEITRISPSAYNIMRLIKVVKLFVETSTDIKEISSVSDYMGGVYKWTC